MAYGMIRPQFHDIGNAQANRFIGPVWFLDKLNEIRLKQLGIGNRLGVIYLKRTNGR